MNVLIISPGYSVYRCASCGHSTLLSFRPLFQIMAQISALRTSSSPFVRSNKPRQSPAEDVWLLAGRRGHWAFFCF